MVLVNHGVIQATKCHKTTAFGDLCQILGFLGIGDLCVRVTTCNKFFTHKGALGPVPNQPIFFQGTKMESLRNTT